MQMSPCKKYYFIYFHTEIQVECRPIFQRSDKRSVKRCNLFLLLQRGFDASGLQRAGDRPEDGGKEDEHTGGQKEGAGGEAGHGLRQQEVTSLIRVWGRAVSLQRITLIMRSINLSDGSCVIIRVRQAPGNSNRYHLFVCMKMSTTSK